MFETLAVIIFVIPKIILIALRYIFLFFQPLLTIGLIVLVIKNIDKIIKFVRGLYGKVVYGSSVYSYHDIINHPVSSDDRSYTDLSRGDVKKDRRMDKEN